MPREHAEDRSTRGRRMAVVASLLLLVVLFLLPPALWGVINYVPPFRPDLPPLPSPNGYEVASNALRRMGKPGNLRENVWRVRPGNHPVQERWQGASLPGLEAALRKRRSTLATVRAAFPLEWRVPDPLQEGTSRGAEFHDCSAWFAAESRLARSRGDYDAAMRHCLDALELGSRVCRGGSTRDRYVGQGCQQRALVEAQQVVWHLPRAHLPEYLARVRHLRLNWPPITETLEIDRQQSRQRCIAFFQGLRGKLPWEQAAEGNEQTIVLNTVTSIRSIQVVDLPASSWEGWGQVLTPRVVLLARLDRFFQELSAASALPAPKGVPPPELRDSWVSRFTHTSFTGCYRGEWPRHNLALLEAARPASRHDG